MNKSIWWLLPTQAEEILLVGAGENTHDLAQQWVLTPLTITYLMTGCTREIEPPGASSHFFLMFSIKSSPSSSVISTMPFIIFFNTTISIDKEITREFIALKKFMPWESEGSSGVNDENNNATRNFYHYVTKWKYYSIRYFNPKSYKKTYNKHSISGIIPSFTQCWQLHHEDTFSWMHAHLCYD